MAYPTTTISSRRGRLNRGNGSLITNRSGRPSKSLVLRFALLSVVFLVVRQACLHTVPFNYNSQPYYHSSYDLSLLSLDASAAASSATSSSSATTSSSSSNVRRASAATSTAADTAGFDVQLSSDHQSEEDKDSASNGLQDPSPPALPALMERHDPASRHRVLVADTARERQHNFASLGDPVHLGGGFTLGIPRAGFSPAVFATLVNRWGVRSVVDVGCGRGWTASWFHQRLRGMINNGTAPVIGIDGSPAAHRHSVLLSSDRFWNATTINNNSSTVNATPAPPVPVVHVEHDYTRGPWWPSDTVDLVWAQSFVQQVSLQHLPNYLATFAKAALVVVTVPQDPGWHHVEVHRPEWWIWRLETLAGFRYDDRLTHELRRIAFGEFLAQVPAPDGGTYEAEELWTTLLVFANPRVLGLPKHNLHLFPEFGCFAGDGDADAPAGELSLRECGTLAGKLLETKLDPDLYPPPRGDPLTRAADFDAFVRAQLQRDDLDGVGRESDHLYDTDLLDDLPPGPPVNFSDHGLHRVKRQVLSSLSGMTASLQQHSGSNNSTTATTIASQPPTPPSIPVVLWPYVELGTDENAELMHMEEDGIRESPHLYLSNDIYDFHPDVVWVGDTNVGMWEEWCVTYLELILKARKKRSSRGLPLSWPIFIVDWTDYPVPMRCRIIEQAVGRDFVHYSHRSVVEARQWNDTKGWVDFGFYLDSDRLQNLTYTHTPLIVRTDTVQQLAQVLEATPRNLNLSSPIETLPRPIDVTHLWPHDGEGVGTVESTLRTKVSNVVLDMANATPDLRVHVGLAGYAARDGRRSTVSEYVETMLDSKIVIVTQRDSWEDHYRLFEALTSGALVVMDRMLSLPRGLKDGVSVVEFASEADLRSKIAHYLDHADERLAIAREGRRVAMSRHRSWHRMEEIVFGEPLSRCSNGLLQNPDCPYTVHADR